MTDRFRSIITGHGKNPLSISDLSQTTTRSGEYFRSNPKLSSAQQSFTPQRALNPKKPILSSPDSIRFLMRSVKSGASRSNGIGSA